MCLKTLEHDTHGKFSRVMTFFSVRAFCNATLSINETITTSPNNTNKVGIMTVSNDIEEIVIPSIVIVALFLINAVVLFVIYRYKKRKLPEFTEEELGTLSTNQTKTLQI
uniref:Uncharacterized protein n=1 Tax=Photinus pyralis TaxID=7054 RepID=A0A1Y1MLQ9_PHOPY